VLTQIFVHTKNPDQEAQDLVSGRWSDFNQGRSEPAPQLKRDPISGYEYYQHVGRLSKIPYVLDGLEVWGVTLRHRTTVTVMSPRPGSYSVKRATAFVERSIPPHANEIVGNYQYITVEGKTLDAANLMLDAIIVGQLKPDEVKIDSSFRARLKSFLQKLDFRTDWSWN
jgi:hypothetical protein